MGATEDRVRAVQSAFDGRLLLALVAFNIMVAAFGAATLLRDRQRSEEEARATTRNLSQTLDQSFTGLITEADLGLLAVRDEYQRQLAAGGVDAEELDEFISRQFGYLPRIDSLRVADETGTVRYGTPARARGPVSISDRDYFQQCEGEAADALVLSKPLLGRINQAWAIILARRLRRGDGAFAGVVYLSFRIEQLNALFTALDLGPNGVVALRNESLELIARRPLIGRPEEMWGKRQSGEDLERIATSGLGEETLFVPAGIDGIARMVSYRHLRPYPLYVIVGISRDAYLARWRSDVQKVAALVALSVALSAVFGLLLSRMRRREREAVGDLSRQQERYQVVADNTLDWEFWMGPEGDNLYTSPSCLDVTGYDAVAFGRGPRTDLRRLGPPWCSGVRSESRSAGDADSGAAHAA